MTRANIELYEGWHTLDGPIYWSRVALFFYDVSEFPSIIGEMLEKNLEKIVRELTAAGFTSFRDCRERVKDLMIKFSDGYSYADPYELRTDLSIEGNYLWRVFLYPTEFEDSSWDFDYEIEGYQVEFDRRGFLARVNSVNWNEL
jgi:hypothetical protein